MMTRYLAFILFSCSIWLTACQDRASRVTNLKQDKFIQVYFNQRQTNRKTYIDPYRQIERQGDNLEAIIIEAIESATSTIDLAVLELKLPNVALALAEKQRSGVRVRVIVDNNYSRPLSDLNKSEISKLESRDRSSYEEFFRLVDLDNNGKLSQTEIARGDAMIILKNAAIPLIDDTADGSRGSGLMHHKFIVIDNQTIVTGSANFTLSDIHGDFANSETQGNANYLMTINNRQLANLFTEEFSYMWGDGIGGEDDSQFGLKKPYRSPQTITWDNTQVKVQFSPTSTTKNWQVTTNGLIGNAIASVTSSINLALFVFSEQELADILETKQQQNISIKGVFDPEFAFRYYSETLDMLGVTLQNRCQTEANNRPWQKPITDIGIPQLSKGDKLHHKFASLDRHITITGSQNWSPTANYVNDETVLIIDNPTVNSHFEREFSRLYDTASLGLPQSVVNKMKVQQQQCSQS
jgi:phosphatidylserine/phosphatidylglycerophosphate/cardiolipin synthase-like enzyme